MDTFYCPPERISGNTILIEGEEFTHLAHVMRKKPGDLIRIVDGAGWAYDVVLEEVGRKSARGVSSGKTEGGNEPALAVSVAAGVVKNPARFDVLVEKVTELGAREIIPLHTERSVPSHARAGRWRRIALAAMKQSGRSFLPPVRELTTLASFLGDIGRFELKLLAHEKPIAGRVFPTAEGAASAVILVGPEGGFSDAEVEACLGRGCAPVYLGDRRLRTETAAIAAVARLVR